MLIFKFSKKPVQPGLSSSIRSEVMMEWTLHLVRFFCRHRYLWCKTWYWLNPIMILHTYPYKLTNAGWGPNWAKVIIHNTFGSSREFYIGSYHSSDGRNRKPRRGREVGAKDALGLYSLLIRGERKGREDIVESKDQSPSYGLYLNKPRLSSKAFRHYNHVFFREICMNFTNY